MWSLLLSIVLTSVLYLFFRAFSRFGVDFFAAIVINYFICVVCGWQLTDNALGNMVTDVSQSWFTWALVCGCLFIVNFSLTAYITEEIGITVSSVAGKMSFVIPFLWSLLIMRTSGEFSYFKIIGLPLAFIAVICMSGEIRAEKKHPWWMLLIPFFSFFQTGFIDSMLNWVNHRYLNEQNQIRFVNYIFTMAFLTGAVVLLINRYRGNIVSRRTILAGLILGVPNYFSIYFFMKALSESGNNGAFVFSVYNLSIIILNTFAGVIVFKERFTWLNGAGVVLSIVSLILFSL